MKSFILALAVFVAVPAIGARQTNSDQKSTPAPTQETAETPRSQPSENQAMKPGHPLDPADVDTLTGKRDREVEASRRKNSILLDGYGAYGSTFGRNEFDHNQREIGLLGMDLPLRRISNPFFFFNGAPGGFSSRGSGGRGGRRARVAH